MRFPGFEGEWEEAYLSDMADIARGKSKHRPRDAAFLFGGQYPFIQTGDVKTAGLYLNNYKQTYSEAGLRQSKLWDKNTLCITIAANIAETTILNIKACFPDSIIGLLPKEDKSNVVFIKYQFDKFKADVQKLSEGIAQANLNLEKLLTIKFSFPSLAEQEKIATLLTIIERRIETQNKIIKELNVLKTTLTKEIFSRHLRFKNAKGNNFPDWKLMTLGDIGEVRMCRRIFNDETSSNADIPFFKIGSFGKEADAFISKKLYEDYREKFSFPKKGDILISAAGTIGRTVVYKGEDAYYQDSNIVWIDNDNTKVVNEFLYYILQIVKYNTEGGTIQRLYNNILKSTKFSCPSFPEQTKIANFLFSIDSKIDVEIQLLQKLEEQKKFLLQQMFV